MPLPRDDRAHQREILHRFLRDLPLAIRELERAVMSLLDSMWEEPFRQRAYQIAVALTDASVASGLSEIVSYARSIASLLRLRLEDILSIQDALKEKLVELLGYLKEWCVESDRSAQG